MRKHIKVTFIEILRDRLNGEMRIYFPEYKDALGKVDGAFSLELLKQAPFPDDLVTLGADSKKDWISSPFCFGKIT